VVADVLALLAELGDVAGVESGTVETLAGERVGRFQLDLRAGDQDRVTERLRAFGLHVEVTV
jgi:hypothetical protein